VGEGGYIREGYSNELDQLVLSFKEIKDWIGSLEGLERERTGIRQLKVGFNKVFGYYFEISHANKDKVPDTYIRKQTLTNAERYITPELKEKEVLLLNGEEKQKTLELALFQSLLKDIHGFILDLQTLSKVVAEIDCTQSLALVSHQSGYVRPVFTEESECDLVIEEGRHPVLEKNQDHAFIPNSFNMTKEFCRFMLITGPNMAGKSTVMRQAALFVVMAQIGCFVPATSCRLSIVDKLFTRIGALDNLYLGQSTFMVEMLETASILHNATPKSLIILDEVGRGTSTFDGMSIATAITEHIYHKMGARTLFATHYHELTALEIPLACLKNYNMQISENGDDIVFTYRLVPGAADKSYGVHVAKMAGLPKAVVQRAASLLEGFEVHGTDYLSQKNGKQLVLFN
ncbi:MAG: DNA mismatch repair protein MutS, partial [Candidatus Margulisbacteria bacterium]|nr:DNA mismatch repair protein MutS [Candidatus Margulisiibacteriota bacterium]